MVDTPADDARGRKADFIPLPAEMGMVVTDHDGLLNKVRKAAVETGRPPSEDRIWDVIAEHHSPEWVEARDFLRQTEARLNDVMSPDNTPLGLIGQAMESEETTHVESQHALALACFTIFNEEVRQNDGLKKVFERIAGHVQVMETSLMLSHNIKDITRQAQQTIPDKVLDKENSLSSSFSKAMGALFGKKPAFSTRPGDFVAKA
jgi:hypothetical protein